MTILIPPLAFPVLSLDPSSLNIGWALLGPGPSYLASNTFLLPSAPPDERVPMVGPAIVQILNSTNMRPGRVLIEIPDYIDKDRVDATKIIPYFRAVGAVEATIAAHNLPIIRIHASRMKQLNHKHKNKDLFMRVVGRHPITDDESDALAQAWEYVTTTMGTMPPPKPQL